MKTFPTLYYKARTGALHQWRVWADGPFVHTEYGQVEGKKQTSRKKAEATNVGRSNERSEEAQAEFDALSLFTYKKERKYSETPEDAEEELDHLPMLAHEFEKRGKKLQYPVDVQPKLDGVRCLAKIEDGKVELVSRSGKPWNVPHIAEMLSRLFPRGNYVLDGELYVRGESLQTITSWVKKLRPETERIQYWIYDVPVWNGEEGLSWGERRSFFEPLIDLLRKTKGEKLGPADPIVIVWTGKAETAEEVHERERKFVADGFEGAIVRTGKGLYEWGHRSPDLLKVKSFKDAEYEVVGFQDGVGKMEGAVVWTCKTPEGKHFNVTPKCSMEERREFFWKANRFVGKKLTVRYFTLSDDRIPIFPVGIGFRCEEDLS